MRTLCGCLSCVPPEGRQKSLSPKTPKFESDHHTTGSLCCQPLQSTGPACDQVQVAVFGDVLCYYLTTSSGACALTRLSLLGRGVPACSYPAGFWGEAKENFALGGASRRHFISSPHPIPIILSTCSWDHPLRDDTLFHFIPRVVEVSKAVPKTKTAHSQNCL